MPVSLNSIATKFSFVIRSTPPSALTLQTDTENAPPFGMASRALTATLTMASSSSARSI